MKNIILDLSKFDQKTENNINAVFNDDQFFERIIIIELENLIKEIKDSQEITGLKKKVYDLELKRFCDLALKLLSVNLKAKKTKEFTKELYLSYFERLLEFFSKFFKNLR